MYSNYSLSICPYVSAIIHRPARGAGSAGATLLDLQLRHLPGARCRRLHVEGGRSRISSSDTSRWPAVDVFTLMVGDSSHAAPAPPGGPPSTFSHRWWALPDLELRHLSMAHRRGVHVDGGRSETFSSGTSQGSVVDVFTLMVGAPGPSTPAPPGGPPSTSSR
jgi:hypothetical protein